MLYPTWKLNGNWSLSGAVQVYSRPYFYEEFSTQGRGVKTDVLQAHLAYSKFWNRASLVVRAGQLSSAFGSFLLRYDDAANPVIDVPLGYGYYYKGVTSRGLAGVQADVTAGRFDARAQFVNSSPSNRRSIFDGDQYGNWAGGAGLTIRQGFRLGVSAFRGPYLHREHRFFSRGEAKPRDLPGTAYGVDVQWGRGSWNVYAELQRFQMIYKATPTRNTHNGYVETRRVLHPRWYAAARVAYLRSNKYAGRETIESAIGFRPNRYQLVKAGYQIQRGAKIRGSLENTFAVQLVTSFHPVSIARD